MPEYKSIQKLRELIEIREARFVERVRRWQEQAAEQGRRRQAAEQTLAGVLASKSWRWSQPLRSLAWQLRSTSPKNVDDESDDAPSQETTAEITAAAPANVGSLLDGFSADLAKEQWTRTARAQLRSFLAGRSSVRFPVSPNPEVSVLLVLFNKAELTFGCLRSLQEITDLACETIIVDNASSDDTETLLSKIEGANVIRNTQNLHFLKSVNQAARAAGGRYLLILNNDTQLVPGSLEAAVATIRSSDDIGAVGGRLILPDGTLQEAGSIVWNDGSCAGYGRGEDPFDSRFMFRRDVDYCSGAFLLTPRKVFERLGGFDAAFSPAYYEETNYCMRLWADGLRVVYEPAATILHYEFGSASTTESALNLQEDHRRIFVEKHRDQLLRHSAPGIPEVARFAAQLARPNILIIDDRVPHRSLGSGFPRAHAVITWLVQEGYRVTLFPTAEGDRQWAVALGRVPREVEVVLDEGISLAQFLEDRSHTFQRILISRPHNMKIFTEIRESKPQLCSEATVVYDAESLFTHRELGLSQLQGHTITPEKEKRLLGREIDLVSGAQAVVTVSEKDRAVLEDHGIENVHVLGHVLISHPTVRGFEERSGFLFVGPVFEESSPNGDSLLWFIREILPRIREALDRQVSLTVAGIHNVDSIRMIADGGVHILGRVEELTDLYDAARVFVAPTRYAAGLPHKVHEAAAYGLPVVATPVLVDQLGWRDLVELSVAGDAESFAHRCAELHEDPRLWRSIRQAALDRVSEECSPERFEATLNRILADSPTTAPRYRDPDREAKNSSSSAESMT